MTREHPELRIVSDELWNAAHKRMAAAKTVYRNDPSDRERNTGNTDRLGSGLESKHLLAGFLVCGLCGTRLIVNTQSQRNKRTTTYYICSGRRVVGKHVCENKYGVEAGQLTDAVLTQLRDALLNPTAVGELLTRELDRQRTAPAVVAAERATLAATVAKLDAEIRNLVRAVEAGAGEIQMLVAGMTTKQTQHDAAVARLAAVAELARKREAFDVIAWFDATRELLNDVRSTLETDPRAGRRTLRQLLTRPITVTPTVVDGVVSFDFKTEASWREYAEGTARSS